MPRGNRMGPVGAGSLTGRGAGWCAGNDQPGYVTAAAPRGWGFGCGRGGRRLRHMRYGTEGPRGMRFERATSEEPRETALLKAQAGWLADQLATIRKRIDDLEGRDFAGATE